MLEPQPHRLRSIGFGLCIAFLPALVMAGSRNTRDGVAHRPISEPTIITEPGSYVVTNDIDGVNAEYCVISIKADDVQLDINGFLLDANAATGLCARDVARISITNGRLHSDSTDDGDDQDEDVRNLIFENVSDFVLSRIVTLNSGEFSMYVGDCSRGLIEDNEIAYARKGATVVRGMRIAVRDNVVQGRLTVGCDGCRVTGNTVVTTSASTVTPVGELRIIGNDNFIADNVASSATLFAEASDNVLRGNLFNAGAGLVIHGQRNRIIGNTLTYGTGFGLRFTSASRNNYYDANTAFANAGGACAGPTDSTNFCDAGTNNVSGDRNYMVPAVVGGD